MSACMWSPQHGQVSPLVVSLVGCTLWLWSLVLLLVLQWLQQRAVGLRPLLPLLPLLLLLLLFVACDGRRVLVLAFAAWV